MIDLDTGNCAAQLDVEIQHAIADADVNEGEEPPSDPVIRRWAELAYQAVAQDPSELTIRLVSAAEITSLNRDYRDLDQATNVLSFPFEMDPEIDFALLGDIVICHSVAVAEAQQQNKRLADHYAHLVTHGVLHLCGYDHEQDDQAEIMETLEIELLASQGISNPYITHQ